MCTAWHQHLVHLSIQGALQIRSEHPVFDGSLVPENEFFRRGQWLRETNTGRITPIESGVVQRGHLPLETNSCGTGPVSRPAFPSGDASMLEYDAWHSSSTSACAAQNVRTFLQGHGAPGSLHTVESAPPIPQSVTHDIVLVHIWDPPLADTDGMPGDAPA